MKGVYQRRQVPIRKVMDGHIPQLRGKYRGICLEFLDLDPEKAIELFIDDHNRAHNIRRAIQNMYRRMGKKQEVHIYCRTSVVQTSDGLKRVISAYLSKSPIQKGEIEPLPNEIK